MFLTIIESSTERVHPKTKALAATAKRLATVIGQPSVALVVSSDPAKVAQDLGAYFDRMVSCTVAAEEAQIIDAVASAVQALTAETKPRAILLMQSVWGREVAGAISGRSDLAVVSDVLQAEISDTSFVVTLNKLGGAVTTKVSIDADACVVLALQQAPDVAPEQGFCSPSIEILPIAEPHPRIIEHASSPQGQGEVSLDTADIIVSGGKGFGGPDPFTGMLRELSNELGAGLGATRAVVDSGWVPHSMQIGQTGKTVAPRLYIALAISGQIQHRVGMQTSTTIVSVNKDPNAPIAGVSDLVVVGDVFSIIPALTNLLRKEKVNS